MTAARESSALLERFNRGGDAALEELFTVIYGQLHDMAARLFARERPEHTLQPTALLHELFIELSQQRQIEFSNESHFFAIAALTMRRILVGHARRKGASKRAVVCVSLNESQVQNADPDALHIDLLALDRALMRLQHLDALALMLVELRYFGGFSVDEAAALLEQNSRTLYRKWAWAKAWLQQQLSGA